MKAAHGGGNQLATRTRVKICGITRLEDALLAADCGAHALGFIFYEPSPRATNPEAAREIIRQLPPLVATVGVFVNEAPHRINEIARACRLDKIQLHGGEPPEMLEQLERPGYRALKLKDEKDLERAKSAPEHTVMLDTYDPDLHGGTGRPANWDWAQELGETRRVILAGGINPGNVSRALVHARPYAVDASSGLEAEPGIKDPEKIKNFFEAIMDTINEEAG